jgi:hypothetical protein
VPLAGGSTTSFAARRPSRLIGVNDLVGGTDCLHPDNSGHDKIADAFDAVIPEVTGPPPLDLSSG